VAKQNKPSPGDLQATYYAVNYSQEADQRISGQLTFNLKNKLPYLHKLNKSFSAEKTL